MSPHVLNGFLTWLNIVKEKRVGELAPALHLNMLLASCTICNFPHVTLRHQWEWLCASLM